MFKYEEYKKYKGINLFALKDAKEAATILIELSNAIKDAKKIKQEAQSKETIEQLVRELEQIQDDIENQLINIEENSDDCQRVGKICGAIVGTFEFIIPYNRLHIAIVLDDIDRCKKYIESNPELMAPDNFFKKTPLMYACETGKWEAVGYLVKEKGVNVNACDTLGNTALKYAYEGGNIGVVKFLARKGAKLRRDTMFNNLLRTACIKDHLDIVKHLIEEKGADVNFCDQWGYTPLIIACERGHISVVSYLLETGKITNESCSKVLLESEKREIHSKVQELLTQHVKINTKSSQNFTPDSLPRVKNTYKKSSYK
jgi:hypothetical protein